MHVEPVPLPRNECRHQFKFLTLTKEAGLESELEGQRDFLRSTEHPWWYAVYDFDFDDSYMIVFYRVDGGKAVDIRSNFHGSNVHFYSIGLFHTSNFIIYSNGFLAKHHNDSDTILE